MFTKWQYVIKVHCWGGLGSQLFAWALIEDLQNRFPRRRIILVAHTGGITYRNVELADLAPNLTIRILDDFLTTKEISLTRHGCMDFRGKLVELLKRLALASGFLAEANTTAQFTKLRPWVSSIRGHYSFRSISRPTLEEMQKHSLTGKVALFPQNFEIKEAIGIHYRLGDLLDLSEKTFVQAARILKLIENDYIDSKFDWCVVFSDSPIKAKNLLHSLAQNFDLEIPEENTLSTIQKLSQYRNFIGTNSKISIWVVLFRDYLTISGINYLPIDLRPSTETLFSETLYQNVDYYP